MEGEERKGGTGNDMDQIRLCVYTIRNPITLYNYNTPTKTKEAEEAI